MTFQRSVEVMSDHAQERTVPPWVYKLFTGQQYPYVRRQAKFAVRNLPPGTERGEPSKEEVDAKFWEIYPHCWVKVLQEVKSGMIVTFHELGTYSAGEYQALVEAPEDFLAKTYGKKKIKINFYYGDNFVCTINFKVAGWTSHDETIGA
jgi:hypothetical protein